MGSWFLLQRFSLTINIFIGQIQICHVMYNDYRAAACDVTGGVASLYFDATELQIFKGNLGSPSNPNLQYGHFETYH